MLKILKLPSYAIAGWIPGGRKYCPVCDRHIQRFMPLERGSRGTPPLIRALDMIGSDTDHYECPHCGANDRERHLLLYMRRSGLLERIHGRALLHFAPEKHLTRLLRMQSPSTYVAADLFPNAHGIQRVDMLAIPFTAGCFDLLIANHVLEHVPDASKALAELFRVLKPGGEAILQTPYSSKLQRTWEDRGIDTPQARLQAYGQEDHVRLFGRDIFERVATVGFIPCIQQHADLLTRCDPREYGVNAKEPFFLFRKPA